MYLFFQKRYVPYGTYIEIGIMFCELFFVSQLINTDRYIRITVRYYHGCSFEVKVKECV